MPIYYTYLIGWSSKNIWYYGSSYNKNSNPIKLWNPYKTSSRHVKNFIKENGNPDIIQIRKTFNISTKCREWEAKVLRRMYAAQKHNWLNKHNGSKKFICCAPHSDNTKEKISKSLKGRIFTVEHRLKLSIAAKKPKSESHRENLKTTHQTEEYRKLMSDKKIGHVVTEKTKEKIRNTLKEMIYNNVYIPPMKGKQHTPEAKEKIRKARLNSILKKPHTIIIAT